MALRFSNETTIRAQMKARGWTDVMLEEAMKTKGILAAGKKGLVTRYIHPATGKSVVVDDATGEVFHIGGEGLIYE